ncbi:12545_t:CDS:2, partial [Gigaspora rosea]
PERNIAEDALNVAAEAITTFANALEHGSEYLLIKVDFYHSNGTQNPDNAQKWLYSLADASNILIESGVELCDDDEDKVKKRWIIFSY